MSKSNNLTDFLTNTADAIRHVKGSTALINPQNFESEIKSLIYLPDKGTALNSFPWKTIKFLSDNGLASDYFSLGDTKTFTVGGNTFTAKLVDTAYNGQSGMVFLATTNANVVYQVWIGEPPNNTGGWGVSPLRTTLDGSVLSSIQSDLRNIIKEVSVKYGQGGSSASSQSKVSSVNCKLFLPSVSEIQGNSRVNVTGYTIPGDGSDGRWNLGTKEGEQLQYFKNNPANALIGYAYNTRTCISGQQYIAFIDTHLHTESSNGLTCYAVRIWGTTIAQRLAFLFVI